MIEINNTSILLREIKLNFYVMKCFFHIFVCFVFFDLQLTIRCEKSYVPTEDEFDSFLFYKKVVNSSKNDDLPLLTEQNQNEIKGDQNDQYEIEKLAGDVTDLLGANVHYRQQGSYNNFGRRFVLQYPYGNGSQSTQNQPKPNYLTPVKAPPELVLAVAKESALRQAMNPVDPVPGIIKKSILRSGDYWNAVWKEEIDNPINLLRSGNDKDNNKTSHGIDVVKAKVMPGSKLFRLISVLKQFSPRLLYVINKGNKE